MKTINTTIICCFYLSKRRQMQLYTSVNDSAFKLFLPFKKKADATQVNIFG